MRIRTIIFLLIVLGSSTSIAQTFDLNTKKVAVGDIYNPKSKILFELASYAINPDSYEKLDSIAKFLIEHNNLIVEVGTHTDSRISKASSCRLDQKRSETIVEYLIKKGVRANCLIAKGYGDSALLIGEDKISKMKTKKEKEKAHAINRRTEFKIIAIQ